MKKFYILIAFTLIYTVSNSQVAKSVYFELGGPGLASFNFDTRFSNKQDGIGGRIGIGGFSLRTLGDRVTTIFLPIGLTYLLGKNTSNYFEVGGGVTPVFGNSTLVNSSSDFSSTFGWASFGYRLQPLNKGFTFRAAINPIIAKGVFWPYYGGVSFGYKF